MSTNLEKQVGHIPPKPIPVPLSTTFAESKTAAVGFFSDQAGDLFTLNPGIPAIDAIEQASGLLAAVIDTVRRCGLDQECTDSSIWTAVYVAEMVKALLDGVIKGQLGGR